MSFLDQLLNGIKNVAIGGAIVATTGPAPTLNFVSGATAVYNAGTKSYDVTISGGGGGAPTGVDVKGADSAHFYVGSISGFAAGGGTIPVAAQTLQFTNTQTTPGIAIAAPGSDVATTTLVLAGQPAFSNSATHVPGTIDLHLGHATSGAGGGSGGVIATEGGVVFFRLDNGTVSAGTASLWIGQATPTSANANLYFTGGTDLILSSGGSTPSSIDLNTVGLVILSLGATANQFFQVNMQTAPFYTTVSGGGHSLFEAGAWGATHRYTALNSFSVVTPLTSTQIPSGDGVTYIANAVTNPTSSPVGGALLYAPNGSGQLWVYQSDGTNFQITSGGSGSVHWGADLNGSNSTSAQWVASLSGQGGSTNGIPIRSGAYIQPTTGAGTHPIIGDGTTIFFGVNSSGGTAAPVIGTAATQPVFFTDAGVTFLSVDPFGNINVQPSSGNATLQFGANVAGTANNLLLVGQQSTGGTAGNVVARVYAPGGGTTEAYFQVVRNLSGTDTMRWAFGQLTTGKAAAWANGVSPSNTNYVLGASASVVQLNAPTTTLFLSIAGGTPFAQFGAAATDYLAFGATPATSGYIQLSGTAGATATLIASSNHNNSATVKIVAITSGDILQIGDGTNGNQIAYSSGSTASHLFINGASTSLCEFLPSLLRLYQTLDYSVTGGTSTSATAGTHGDVPAQVVGYLNISVNNTTGFRIPYYNT